MSFGVQLILGFLLALVSGAIWILVSSLIFDNNFISVTFLVILGLNVLPAVFIGPDTFKITDIALKNILFISSISFFAFALGVCFLGDTEGFKGIIPRVLICLSIYIFSFSLATYSAYNNINGPREHFSETTENYYELVSNKDGDYFYLVSQSLFNLDHYVVFFKNPDNNNPTTLCYKKIPSSDIVFLTPTEDSNAPYLIERITVETDIVNDKRTDTAHYSYIVYVNNPIDYIKVVGTSELG